MTSTHPPVSRWWLPGSKSSTLRLLRHRWRWWWDRWSRVGGLTTSAYTFSLFCVAGFIAFISAERSAQTSLQVVPAADVMHALSRTPGINVRVWDGSLRPLLFTAAMVASVEDGEDDGKGGQTDDQDDEHDDPFPVSRKPIHQATSVSCVVVGLEQDIPRSVVRVVGVCHARRIAAGSLHACPCGLRRVVLYLLYRAGRLSQCVCRCWTRCPSGLHTIRSSLVATKPLIPRLNTLHICRRTLCAELSTGSLMKRSKQGRLTKA